MSGLSFDVQARVAGDGIYQPLVNVGGLPCWPSEPDWSQLVDGARYRSQRRDLEAHDDDERTARVRLAVGADFHLVVLGIGLGAVPHTCREILARDRRWREMVANVKTVPTRALQLWLSADRSALGWDTEAVSLSGFLDPFDTWADMTHLVTAECWARPPRSIAYFCSAMPEPPPGTSPARAAQAVRAAGIELLEQKIHHLWPRARLGDGTFPWEWLVDPAEPAPRGARKRGRRRLDTQYFRANVNPSDRYTLALPGSSRYLISPLDPTYENFAVAGDWTETGLNLGCVEGAVMSGLLAAHALSGAPALESIDGYDHP